MMTVVGIVVSQKQGGTFAHIANENFGQREQIATLKISIHFMLTMDGTGYRRPNLPRSQPLIIVGRRGEHQRMTNYQSKPKDFKIEKWEMGIHITNIRRFWSDVIPFEVIEEMYRLAKSGKPKIVRKEKRKRKK